MNIDNTMIADIGDHNSHLTAYLVSHTVLSEIIQNRLNRNELPHFGGKRAKKLAGSHENT